jgi:hypothetical protein
MILLQEAGRLGQLRRALARRTARLDLVRTSGSSSEGEILPVLYTRDSNPGSLFFSRRDLPPRATPDPVDNIQTGDHKGRRLRRQLLKRRIDSPISPPPQIGAGPMPPRPTGGPFRDGTKSARNASGPCPKRRARCSDQPTRFSFRHASFVGQGRYVPSRCLRTTPSIVSWWAPSGDVLEQPTGAHVTGDRAADSLTSVQVERDERQPLSLPP